MSDTVWPSASDRALFLPESYEDYVARRELILRPGYFPVLPYDTVGLPPVGIDFQRYAETICGSAALNETEALKGLRGNARKEAKARLLASEADHRLRFEPAVEYVHLLALYADDFWMKVQVKKRLEDAVFCPGTTDGSADLPPFVGPPHHLDPRLLEKRIMVVGKFAGMDDRDRDGNLAGGAAEMLRAYQECGIAGDDVAHWYFTHLVKHKPLDPSSTTLPKDWVNNCAPLLYNELCLFRPHYVLCLGSDTAKAVIGPTASVTKLMGRVVDGVLTDHRPGETKTTVSFQSMASIHPSYAAKKPEAFPDLVNAVGAFWSLVNGVRAADSEVGLRHVEIYTLKHLRNVVDEIIADAKPGVHQPIAVDLEWHGRWPGESNAYVRTVQFTHKPKTAFCLVLRSEGGKTAFRGGQSAAVKELNRLLKSTPGKKNRKVRLGGHYLRADLPWLMHLGVDPREEYRVAKTPELTKTQGGWDTMTMCHAYMESIEGGYKLENLAARFCGIPRYDEPLDLWKKEYKLKRGFKDADLEGYGMIPDELLHKYASYDVDATIRLFERFNGVGDEPGLLDGVPGKRVDSREASWTSHNAALAALEMEMNGVLVDRNRGDELTRLFMDAKVQRLHEFRTEIGWKDFNPGSTQQVQEFLFGEAYNGRRDPLTQVPIRIRPKGVATLRLTPVKTTGKRGKVWERVVTDRQEHLFSASTDKETLGILSHAPGLVRLKKGEAPVDKWRLVAKLLDIKRVTQVLQGTLRKPIDVNGVEVTDEDDNLEYDGGLLYFVNEDGRVRTHFGMVETGRWSSWKCNLQNISKRREDDYKRILKEKYKFPIRSIITARPGCLLIEADYKMAEMAGIGMLAQDDAMLEVVRRNCLDDDHPDFLDPHGAMAFDAFRVDNPENRKLFEAYNAKEGTNIKWAATKACLKALGRESLRVAAKNVAFGVPYGRSADAISRQCREENAEVSVEDAQKLIDAYLEKYPDVAIFLELCKACVADPGYMIGSFGRPRRFAPASDRSVVGEQERQAMNFVVQNLVAEVLRLACAALYDYRSSLERSGDPRTFDMLLPIHDALLFEVPYEHVVWFVDEVLPMCMVDKVDIWPRDLAGHPLPGVEKPYHLNIDTEVYRYWGEKIDREWGLAEGLPEMTPKKNRILPEAKPVKEAKVA